MYNTSKQVAIVILNYNGWKDTIECLESVMKSDFFNYKIVIVDNASTDDSFNNIIQWLNGNSKYILEPKDEYVQYIYPLEIKPISFTLLQEEDVLKPEITNEKIVLIQAKENKGFSAGNNLGIKYAMQNTNCDYFWLLNNDTVIQKNTLSSLLSCYIECNHLNSQKTGIVGSKLLFYYKPDMIQAIGGSFNKYTAHFSEIGKNKYHNNFEFSSDIDYAIGASMLVSREFIEDVGLLYEEYFLYYEEIDWCLRALKYNYKTIHCQNSIVYHKEGGSTKNNKEINLTIEYYKYNNLKKLYNRFFKHLIFIVYYRLLLKAMKELFKGRYKQFKLIINVFIGRSN